MGGQVSGMRRMRRATNRKSSRVSTVRKNPRKSQDTHTFQAHGCFLHPPGTTGNNARSGIAGTGEDPVVVLQADCHAASVKVLTPWTFICRAFD